MLIYDISQTVSERIAAWPGDQRFRYRWSHRIQSGASCNVSAVTMSVHTGTHLDAPYHFDDFGPDIGSVPLRHFIGPARVFAVPAELESISAAFLEGLDWDGVERVLFRTRKKKKFQTVLEMTSKPCEKCNVVEYEVSEKDIIDVLDDLASQTDARVEVISTESEEKARLTAVGGFAAILRYNPEKVE